MTQRKSIAARLDAHLNAEYKALIDGDLAKIETLAEEKVALLETIEKMPLKDLEQFQVFRERLLRHQILTQSALEGMRAAILRAKEVQSVSKSLSTYTARGSQTRVSVEMGQTLSKRS